VTDSATLSTPISADPPVVKMDRRAIGLLALGHFADDINQSFLPGLLPLLVVSRHLTYQAAGTLVLAQAISSSFVQPLIGYIADKKPMPWLAGLGLLLAGLGVAGIGFMPSYGLIFVCALISGLGVAMFHPEAARFANLAAGSRKASGMRWFAVGGNIGFAAGPAFAAVALAAYGITGTFLAAIPVAIMSVVLLRETSRMHTFVPKRVPKGSALHIPDDWSGFARLTAFLTVRSTVYLGLVSFIPLYFVGVVHASHSVANMISTTFLFCGIAGTIAGGSLADTYGRRVVIWVAMGASLVFLVLFAQSTNFVGGLAVIIGFVLAVPLGIAVSGSQAATIILGQEYLPNRLGIASGITLGVGVSIGGMFTPVLGRIADGYGLHAALITIAALAALSLLLGFTLPDPAKRRAMLAASAAA
jgi:FSR family fosmidomycin resistance protein-like MFS transporter